MSILTQVASREDFLLSVYQKSKSHNSQNMAKKAFRKWDLFLRAYGNSETELIVELKKISNEPEFYQFLNRFVQFMVGTELSRNAVISYFNQIKGWLRYNAIRIHNDDVKQFVTFPKEIKESKYPLEMEHIQKIHDNTNSKRLKVLLMVLASSGMRLNEALQLRHSDIEGNTIRLRAMTTKTRTAREAKMSRQALEAIKTLRFKEFVFVKEWSKHSVDEFEKMFAAARKKAGLVSKYENGRMYLVNLHAFRAFFNTTATRILGDGIAHALIGHGAYLGQYTRLTQKEKDEMYEKLEPFVTLNQPTDKPKEPLTIGIEPYLQIFF